MVAYDCFKVIDKRLHKDPEATRKSLESLVGKKIPIVAGYVKPGMLRELEKKRHQQLGIQ
jgi:hypothetical protein